MKRHVVGVIAAAVLTVMSGPLAAQTKTVHSEMRTESGTIEAIETASRSVTIKKADGTYVTVVAGPDIARFAELKVGDKVNAKYYENVVLRLKAPGEPDVDSASKSTTGAEMVMPGGTRARQRTVTATITGLDMNTPMITFTGPNGWKYTSRVDDKASLAKVKVGDRVDVVWTEATVVSLEAGK